jgi:hypothetical protein
MRKALVLWLLTVPLVSLAQASGPAPAPESTVHRHLGFYLHLDIGVGYLSSSPSQPSGASSVSGAALPFSIVIGGAVAEDWILAGDLWAAAGPSPSGSSWGNTAFGGLGFNVTHYFMPANVYISLTPSFTSLVFDTNQGYQNFADRAATGFGVKVAVGKEWWVSDHWGLGVAAQGYFAANKGNGIAAGTNWTTWGGGFVFSATYN